MRSCSSAFEGGLATALLGVLLHFFIAFAVVASGVLLNGLLIHALGVGLPAALSAQAARPRA